MTNRNDWKKYEPGSETVIAVTVSNYWWKNRCVDLWRWSLNRMYNESKFQILLFHFSRGLVAVKVKERRPAR